MHAQDSAAFALQEVIELANGCLCCSVKNDFVQALEAMMQRRSKFDYILIETTGKPMHAHVQNPCNISYVAWLSLLTVHSSVTCTCCMICLHEMGLKACPSTACAS